jgi:hypothetical protein
MHTGLDLLRNKILRRKKWSKKLRIFMV